MEKHKRQKLEKTLRVQFCNPFLEPESEAVDTPNKANRGTIPT